MSQIGYMFVGVGVGAYSNGMFHLLTHAFFKALLFLAAGLVIHALAGEQDMRKMGGLRKLMPLHVLVLPRRRARARRHPAVRRLLLEGLDPRRDARARDVRRDPLGRRRRRHVPDRPLHVPHALPRLLGRAERVRARAPPRGTTAGKAPPTMFWPVAVLARALDRRRLDPVRATSGRRSRTSSSCRRRRSSRRAARRRSCRASSPSLFGLVGIASRGRSTARSRVAVPRVPQVQTALEHKLWFDELYDVVFYRPAVWLARALEPLDRAAADPRLGDRGRARHAAGRPRSSAACRPASCARTRSRSPAGSPSSSSSSSRCAE